MNKVQNYKKEEKPHKQQFKIINPLSSTPNLKIAQLSAIVLFSIIITTSLSQALPGPGISVVYAQNQANQTSPIDRASAFSQISKKAVPIQNPNKDVCDIAILRESPQIIGHDGTVLNKFLAINSLVEMMPAQANMSTMSNNSSGPMVVAMGEFALLQTELKPVLLAMSKSNVNITAVHNHPILEKPPMIFVHWDTLGSINTVLNQTKGVVSQFEQLQKPQTVQANNSTGGDPLSQIGETIGGALGLGK
jgi:hypothetical protein